MSDATPPVLAYTHRGRRPFPFRTVAAAAFAVPVLLLWARSYWRADQLNRYAPSGDGRVESESGGLYFEVTPRDPTLPPGWYVDWVSYSWWIQPSSGAWERHWGQPVRRWAGVQWFQMLWGPTARATPVRVVIVSDWVVALIAGGIGWAAGRWLPGAAATAWRAIRRELAIWTAPSG
jgi:hypothetical protein